MTMIKNITSIEAEKIARAIHELRPDWPAKSLHTFILREFANQQYANIAVALTACATALNDEGMPLAETPRYALDAQWLNIIPGATNAIQSEQDKAKAEKERQERLQDIKRRNEAIRECQYCDDKGRNEYGHMCRHDMSAEERKLRAKAHADQARQALIAVLAGVRE